MSRAAWPGGVGGDRTARGTRRDNLDATPGAVIFLNNFEYTLDNAKAQGPLQP